MIMIAKNKPKKTMKKVLVLVSLLLTLLLTVLPVHAQTIEDAVRQVLR